MKIFLTDESGLIKNEKMFDILSAIVLKVSSMSKFQNAEVSTLITDDNSIHRLNLEYRHIDKPTDVLSFAMEDESVGDTHILGDIVISIDTAKLMADEYDMTLIDEVAFLYIHGLLHLLGFDHERSDEDEKIMFQLQESIYDEWKKLCL